MIVAIADDGMRIHVVEEALGVFDVWGQYEGVDERVELRLFEMTVRYERESDLPVGERPAEIVRYEREEP